MPQTQLCSAAAAAIAIETVEAFIRANQIIQGIVFCCFSREDLAIYQRAFLGAGA
jgi:O-acetyl-ADP-ribose deacetylase (regulator of RNase III)